MNNSVNDDDVRRNWVSNSLSEAWASFPTKFTTPHVIHVAIDDFLQLELQDKNDEQHVSSILNESELPKELWREITILPGRDGINLRLWNSLGRPPSSYRGWFGAQMTAIVMDNRGRVFSKQDTLNIINPGKGTQVCIGTSKDAITRKADRVLSGGKLNISIIVQPVKRMEHQIQNPLLNHLTTLLGSEDDSDLQFHMKSGRIIHAHTFILKRTAKELIPLCLPNSDGIPTEIEEDDIVFEALLSFAYGSSVLSILNGDGENQTHIQAIIRASNKYNMVELKWALENHVVEWKILFSWKDMISWLDFAKNTDCALLQEHIMQYIFLTTRAYSPPFNALSVGERFERSWPYAEINDRPALIEELRIMEDPPRHHKTDKMSVSELRQELQSRGEIADGPKPFLKSELKKLMAVESRNAIMLDD